MIADPLIRLGETGDGDGAFGSGTQSARSVKATNYLLRASAPGHPGPVLAPPSTVCRQSTVLARITALATWLRPGDYLSSTSPHPWSLWNVALLNARVTGRNESWLHSSLWWADRLNRFLGERTGG